MWVGLGLAHTSALELNQKTYHTHQLSVASRDNRTHKVLRVVQLVKIAAFFCYEKILFVTNVKDSESLTFANDLVLNLPSPLSLYCCNRRGVGGGGARNKATIGHKSFFLNSQPFLSCILTTYTQVRTPLLVLFPGWGLGTRLLYTNTYLHGYVIRFWLNCKWKKFNL